MAGNDTEGMRYGTIETAKNITYPGKRKDSMTRFVWINIFSNFVKRKGFWK